MFLVLGRTRQWLSATQQAGRQVCRLACVFLGFSMTRVRSTTMFKVLYKALISIDINEAKNASRNSCCSQYSWETHSRIFGLVNMYHLPGLLRPPTGICPWSGLGMAASYLPAVQTGNQGFRPQLLETEAPCWTVSTWVSWYGWGCVLIKDQYTKRTYISYFFSNHKEWAWYRWPQHNLGLSYVGMASPGRALRFHTCCSVEPGSVPVPLQDTHTHTHSWYKHTTHKAAYYIVTLWAIFVNA